MTTTWIVEGADETDAHWLAEAVAGNDCEVAFEDGQVTIDEVALGILQDRCDEDTDGHIELTDDGSMVMWAAGDDYPLRPAN